jgi:hypothetical protein
MRARYTSYEYSACRTVLDHPEPLPAGLYSDMHVERCEAEDAQYWGVYGRNPDGTAEHIGDAIDEESAESIVALLNYLIAPEV